MSCPELLRTQAFLDGELDDKAAAEVERPYARGARAGDEVPDEQNVRTQPEGIRPRGEKRDRHHSLEG